MSVEGLEKVGVVSIHICILTCIQAFAMMWPSEAKRQDTNLNLRLHAAYSRD